MPAKYDYTPGSRFGLLTLIEEIPASEHRQAVFRCDCGNEFFFALRPVARGDRKSCGCLPRGRKKSTAPRAKKAAPEFDSERALRCIWRCIIGRCEKPSCRAYPEYGGRGIRICDRWKTFENFAADMGPRPSPGHSVDRYPDNNGNYEPNNCRWATRTEQQNNMRSNVLLEFRGMVRTLAQWSSEIGIERSVLRTRMKLGWTTEQVLSTPVRPKMPKGSGNAQARYREKMRARRQAAV